MSQFDVVVIGGGIVGLATALQLLQKQPGLSVAVVEKEHELAAHQTGHNSGVIHSGIYYRPGSLKAKNCVHGVELLKQFCAEEGIPYNLCGKVIVATHESELGRLEELERRGRANGVAGLEMIGPERLKEIEPHCQGIRALYAPYTGIIDYKAVTRAYARRFEKLGGQVFLSHRVVGIEEREDQCTVRTEVEEFPCRLVVNCAGLHADRVAKMAEHGITKDRIFPFRGEYYFLKDEAQHMVKGLIYPVPDPSFPFLGVHLTLTIDGRVEAGPNAVLAFSREGYRKSSFNVRDTMDEISYPGFWKMAGRYWKTGIYEMYRSFSKGAFLRALQRFVPDLQASDLATGGAGVRSQLLTKEGKLVDDFAIVDRPRMVHVLSAPSPGATASLAIGGSIAERCLERMESGCAV